MQMELKQVPGGVLLPVRVQPRASRDQVVGVQDAALKVRLTAPPVDGAANQALVKFLAKALGVSKGRLSLVSGQKSRHKLVRVEGLDPSQVAERLGL